mgnify:FL=1
MSTAQLRRIMALEDRTTVARGDHAQDRAWQADCWTWVCDQVQTVDEATQAVRRWPTDKPYLQEVFQALQTERLLAIPKSRRMLLSWCVAMYLSWRARYFPNQLLLVQSATETKAAYLVGERCRFVEEHLVQPQYRRAYASWRTKQGLIGKLRYQGTGSEILSVAQGADIVRSFTFSLLCMDEIEFQHEGAAALVAALPAVEKGAQIVLVSTSNGPSGPMAQLCKEVGFARWAG